MTPDMPNVEQITDYLEWLQHGIDAGYITNQESHSLVGSAPKRSAARRMYETRQANQKR